MPRAEALLCCHDCVVNLNESSFTSLGDPNIPWAKMILYIFAMGIIICRDIQQLKVVNKVVESTVNLTRKFNLDYS